MNIRHHQKGSAHIIIIIILVLALAGALGFIFWQNVLQKNQNVAKTTETNQTTKDETTDTAEKTGFLVGSLTYPSESIPPEVEIHAVNLDTGKEYTTKEHIKDKKFTYGVGYRIEVPAGRYNVYGTLPDQPGVKAYYNQVIVCGIKVECKDTTKIEVKVEEGKESIDATVGDWWSE